MPLDVTTSPVRIARPLRDVTAYAFDPANDPNWIGGISRAETLTQGPIGVGSRVARTASFLGRRIEYVMEVTEHTAGRLAMHAIRSPFPMDVTYSFEGSGDGTTGQIRVAGAPKGYRLAGPILRAMVRRSVTSDLKRLKRILETR